MSDEPKPKPKPLLFEYNAAEDILYVEGIKIHGDVFRVWNLPESHIYKFKRRDDGVVTLQQIEPCLECKEKFSL